MAIKIGGTTVIDNSRNVSNVGSVTATSFSGDGSGLTNLPASGGTYQATASGTLANGDTVVVNSDGTVSAVASTTVTQALGSSTQFSSGTSFRFAEAVYDQSAQKLLIVYFDLNNSYYPTAVVGTISGTSISFGTPVAFITQGISFSKVTATYDINAQKSLVMVDWVDTSFSDPKTSGLAATISGTSVSFGARTDFNNNSGSACEVVYDESAQKSVYFYRDTTNSDYGTARVVTISGTSVSFGTPSVFQSASYSSSSRAAYVPNAQGSIVAYSNFPDLDAVIANISGTSLSFGSPANVGTLYYSPAIAYSPVDQKLLIINSAASSTKAAVVSVSNQTITLESNQQISTDNRATTSVVYDASANKFTAAYANASSSDAGEFVNITISGTTASSSAATQFDGPSIQKRSSTGKWAVYDTNAARVAFLYSDTTNSDAIVLRNASTSTNLTAENYIGISDGAYSNGQTATVQIVGAVDDAQSGLTAGQAYYVQTDGSLSTTPTIPSVFAGTAIASTKLLIKG